MTFSFLLNAKESKFRTKLKGGGRWTGVEVDGGVDDRERKGKKKKYTKLSKNQGNNFQVVKIKLTVQIKFKNFKGEGERRGRRKIPN